MQTNFSPAQLADPEMAASEAVIRKCVHCGFCAATCPTYQLLGDELDSPRGRIYLMKDMLENERVPTPEVVKHIDRCLSCLACMTTCPSDVNFMHLIDHARAYIARRYRRPWPDRLLRAFLALILPHPTRLRLALLLARPTLPLLRKIAMLKPLAALVPRHIPSPSRPANSPARVAKGRVALLRGCAEPVLRPEIQQAAIRLLNRAGYDVVYPQNQACCGALVHHLGDEAAGLTAARRNIDAWTAEIEQGGLDAIIVTTSGCGTTLKDYGWMLRDDPLYAAKAARVAALAKDICEILVDAKLPSPRAQGLVVAYHPACSLQHGQKITDAPQRLLAAAGFTVRLPAEAHMCCGSAGTYNILQPHIAGQLGDRKSAHLEQLKPDAIAAGNIGCMMQISGRTSLPVYHTIELLDWAMGEEESPTLPPKS